MPKKFCRFFKTLRYEVDMADLKKRAQKKKRAVVAGAGLLVAVFVIELSFLAQGQSPQVVSLAALALGLVGVLSLHLFHFKEQKRLVKKAVENLVRQKSQTVDNRVLNKLFEKDFPRYLKACYIFLPTKESKNDSAFSRVEGLQSFVNNYKTYAGLNLLEDFSKEILDKNETFKLNFKALLLEASFFLFPFVLMQLSALNFMFEGAGVLFASLLLFRLFTLSFFLRSYKDLSPVKFEKIEHFLFGSFEVEAGAETTRIELEELVGEGDESVFFLVDSFRKYEIEKLIRFQTSGNKSFKDWSVVSAENSTYKNKVKSSKAFILFPSEMLFPFDEMQDFISAFDKVIIIDSSPSHVLAESSVFYLDQNQKVKRVNFEGNLHRLSGDKGLILRNFKRNNLDLFLTQIEKKIVEKESVYLVYEDVKGKVSCDQSFIYPSGVKMVSIADSVESGAFEHYCSLNEGKHREKLDQAKMFVANCSYHRIYSGEGFKSKPQKDTKVS